ncbi:DUF6089 family protein [Hymenobacter sp. J193]|uniref:DUF6089 family protein n=1 Tax=Hymenobacter sp. J193 TaxID=2898429 RepID=UPI002150DC0B|nr:DUF6089 family protein [Hymenobacter sp. J193]MCR5887737.1 DUF6089 family protein [Hymenobacter sp. J193]
MKKLFPLTLALVLALALVATEASAQRFTKRKMYNSVGVSLNAMNYFGDVVPKTNIASLRLGATRPNIGFTFTRRFAPRLSGRASLSYGRVTGDDAKAADDKDSQAKFRYTRNMNFRNDIFEFAAVGVFDLLENRNNYIRRPDFVPYVFAGVAVFRHNPKGLVGDNTLGLTKGDYVALQPLHTEGQGSAGYESPYKRTSISIPFGGGIRYKLDRHFDLGFEIGWRKTFTDYIDDVGGNYVRSKDDLTSAGGKYFGYEITREGVPGTFTEANQMDEIRGNDNEKDWYIVTGLTLNYILSPRVKSPKFR